MNLQTVDGRVPKPECQKELHDDLKIRGICKKIFFSIWQKPEKPWGACFADWYVDSGDGPS